LNFRGYWWRYSGKIQNLRVTPTSNDADAAKSATVTFEKESAAKTALLLDSTQLGDAQVTVTAAHSLDEIAGSKGTEEGVKDDSDVPQEEKPRARIIAEYLAHGYKLSDQVIQRGIAFDQQHGISTRFQKALTDFESKYHPTERATSTTRSMDDKYKVSSKAAGAWTGLNSYFEKAINTPSGQKLRKFYEQGSKQVLDVHNEAMHLANLKKQQAGGATGESSAAGATGNVAEPLSGDSSRTTCNCHADTKNCPCAPGACACGDCSKNPEVKGTADFEKAGLEKAGLE
jgi:hypothetical protein